MNSEYIITRDEIILVNKKYGGSLRNDAEIETSLYLGKGKNIFRKIAYIWRAILVGHPFTNGNKRTAFEATKIFLLANKIELQVSEIEAEEFMVKMAQPEKLSIKEVEIWIKEHSGKHGKEKV